ncbi:MAG: hypothetical protein Q4F11_06000 [Eubacteriales bacterium]|nr:hypothetical protein [Eubacteriales bacterium]
MITRKLPLNLQFFAEDGRNEPPQQNQNQPAFQFDYDKLANIVNGKQTVTEDTVLKGYFKQQGLSKEEADQAMAQFKAEKAKNQPDVNAIQTQLNESNKIIQQMTIEREATTVALELGLDSKTIPYVLKLANFSGAMGEDGKINAESLKNALNKVLEDVPQLKPIQQESGGFKIGGQGNNQGNATEEQLKAAFGV